MRRSAGTCWSVSSSRISSREKTLGFLRVADGDISRGLGRAPRGRTHGSIVTSSSSSASRNSVRSVP
jgi:hypothetical protein